MTIQEKVAIACGFTEDKSIKGFTSNNKEHCCCMCGNKVQSGVIDKNYSFVSSKNNSLYTFANTSSPFVCQYCLYNSKNYRRILVVDGLSKKIAEQLKSGVLKIEDKILKKAIKTLLEDMKKLVLDLESSNIKPTAPQKTKLKFLQNLEDKEVTSNDLKKIIDSIFNHEILVRFTKNLNLNTFSMQYEKAQDMADFILLSDGTIKAIDTLRGSTNNDIYNILKNPPKAPFIVNIKQQKGSNIVNNVHLLEETVDENYLVINHGYNIYTVKNSDVFSALDDAQRIFKTHRNKNMNISDDVLFNSVSSLDYENWFTKKLRENKLFMYDYMDFINKYDKSVRTVAKIVFNTYLEKKAEK